MNERQNIPSLFRKNVLKHPNKRCFLYEDQVWTFHDVYQFANRVSNYFQKEVSFLLYLDAQCRVIEISH